MTDDSDDSFPPEGVDLHKPSVARVYDYLLGGDVNWAIDREFGDRLMTLFPHARPIAQANRQFLFRAVRQLMRRGVHQFVDLGAGVPTRGHTHAVADNFEPDTARVVYVDNEPVAVAESQILLEASGDPRRHTAINADVRAPRRLWQQVLDTGLIDPGEPVAILLIAVLHVEQTAEDGSDIGAQVVAQYRDLLPSGSYLAITHVTDDAVDDVVGQQLKDIKEMYDKAGNRVVWRSHADIAALFGDFELIEPGLDWVPRWHQEESGYTGDVPEFDPPSDSVIFGGVGRKP